MKRQLFLALLTILSLPALSLAAPSVLVVTVTHMDYRTEEIQMKETKHSYKIALTPEFMKEFKRPPSPSDMGTSFYCIGGNSTKFHWWARYSRDKKLSIHMWASGGETLEGKGASLENPSVSQSFTTRTWEDLDMSYQTSYVASKVGLNVTFAAKVLPQNDPSLKKIPLAPVQTSARTILVEGADQEGRSVKMKCGFQ